MSKELVNTSQNKILYFSNLYIRILVNPRSVIAVEIQKLLFLTCNYNCVRVQGVPEKSPFSRSASFKSNIFSGINSVIIFQFLLLKQRFQLTMKMMKNIIWKLSKSSQPQQPHAYRERWRKIRNHQVSSRN